MKWFADESLDGADFETFGKALVELLVSLGCDVLDMLYIIEDKLVATMQIMYAPSIDEPA